jgi:hypothetical protein
MGGDMNFTTSREEIWGSFPREDVLNNYFLNNFELARFGGCGTHPLFTYLV